ncbi:ZYBA0S06-01772g1_1 [Zygosaccharomyces bailii CLIB 213]|uniref:ZYBA0S06-01772g1_1 n=1 Tax=Zygosaccharomyces bailii (strain CLIB 213 / ATCC 58445 / CBS 680 / BCRC 21525 / NBRC 1098 / NCYC 1416 / NRRL Y-2227) TaxID=1333698 RepID=A0A8J2T8C1_ZYGB2|nr:ZYBA0S06-01772g1_1 [Zygosaccharomyces bailii CLIB 213]
MAKIAIITYSLYGHIDTMAEAVKRGVESAGGKAVIFRVEETLPDEALVKMHAPEKNPDFPVATPETLVDYDGFLFGIPTRFGALPAQWSAFWDQTGGLWTKGSLSGKVAGFFVSTGTSGGGQETTLRTALTYLAHHGILYIPLGYRDVFAELGNVEEVHGGSPWGAGTFAGPDGSRTPSTLELRTAEIQGRTFYKTARRLRLIGKHSLLAKYRKEKQNKNADVEAAAAGTAGAVGVGASDVNDDYAYANGGADASANTYSAAGGTSAPVAGNSAYGQQQTNVKKDNKKKIGVCNIM